MEDQNLPSRSSRILIVVATSLMAGLGCLGALFFTSADAGEAAGVFDQSLEMARQALPEGLTPLRAVGWFLALEGSAWLVGAGLYLALKLPGLEHSPQAEELRRQQRANLSYESNQQAEAALAGLRAGLIRRAITFAFFGLSSLVIAAIIFSGLFEF